MGLESTWPLCPNTLVWCSVLIAIHAVGTGIPLFCVGDSQGRESVCRAGFRTLRGIIRLRAEWRHHPLSRERVGLPRSIDGPTPLAG